ncbi:GxxExxY protein [Flavobacterium sp. MAHUQ-51]|uniref:GxxExxY protein n=1 Tax=Flavobacterium sp. GCM10022190 TaxID=3252639 RepID=UPI0036085757
MKLTKSYLKNLTYEINGAAIEVHKELGPGLLESVYHKCLKKELSNRKISFVSELSVPLNFKGLDIETDLRCDLLIENCIVIELKAIELLAPIHQAQLLTYMKLLKAPKGILYNFHCVNLFNEGQKTFVNEYFKNLPE